MTFCFRGVTPVMCDTDISSSTPEYDRWSDSWYVNLARRKSQWAGTSPKDGIPDGVSETLGVEPTCDGLVDDGFALLFQ